MKRKSWRYLLVRILSDEKLSKDGLKSAISYNIRNLFGEQGLIESWPHILFFNEKSNEAIIRCNRSSLNKIRASLALMTKIDNKAVAVFVIMVSGTIKSLKKFQTE